GGAIGVQFVTGDISMMGLGTVTHVEGPRLCAFGHPMFEAGNTAMPTSIGRVLWIYASDNHSTKIGEMARPLGTLVNDRQSAIGGMPDPGDFGHARVVRAVGDVINNPWENARIEKIETILTIDYTRDLWRLRGVDLLDEVVDAGQSARIVLHLVPFVGPEVRR